MEQISSYEVEKGFENSRDRHEAQMMTNLLLGMIDGMFSDDTEVALFNYLETRPIEDRLDETNKWIGYISRHGEELSWAIWEQVRYIWDIHALEAYFKDMDKMNETEKSEKFNPIEEALVSLKWINSETILFWFRKELEKLQWEVEITH